MMSGLLLPALLTGVMEFACLSLFLSGKLGCMMGNGESSVLGAEFMLDTKIQGFSACVSSLFNTL